MDVKQVRLIPIPKGTKISALPLGGVTVAPAEYGDQRRVTLHVKVFDVYGLPSTVMCATFTPEEARGLAIALLKASE